jgi:hypothetical protein
MNRNEFLGAPPMPELGRRSQLTAENPGLHFSYTPGVATLPPGTAPVAGPPYVAGIPGKLIEVSYQITNNDHDGYHLLVQATGPFLVQIKVGTRYIFNDYQHGFNIFGSQGHPMPFLIPIKTRLNDIVYFELQDISWQYNNVYITVTGAEKI